MADTPAHWRVLWAATARDDLHAIISYIANDSVRAALDVLNKLEQAAARLESMPERGRVVPELATVGVHTYREAIQPPWRIIYRLSEDTVYILAVVDSRRNLADLLMARFLR